MRKLLRIFLTTVVAIVLLILSVTITFLLVSDETRREWLEATFSYATDRQLTVDGTFSLDLGRTIRLHAVEVSIDNAAWGLHPALFHVQQLDASVSLWPLLKGILEFDLALSAPVLMLETNQAGIDNWTFVEASEELNHSKLPFKLVPREIIVTNGQLLYHGHGVEKKDVAKIKRLHLAVNNRQQILELDGHYNDQPLTLKTEQSSSAKGEAELSNGLSISGKLGKLNIRLDGTITDATKNNDPEFDLIVAVDSPSLRFVSGKLGQILPDLGPVKGDARLHGPLSAPVLEDIKANLESSKGSMKVSGSIGNIADLNTLDLQLAAQTKNIVELLETFKVNLPVSLPAVMQAEAKLTGDWPVLLLEDISAKATDSRSHATVSGRVSDLLNLDGVDLLGNVSSPTLTDLPLFRQLPSIPLPKIGPAKATARITSNEGIWSIQQLKVDARNEDGWIRYQASIPNLADLHGSHSELQGQLQSLEQLHIKIPAGTIKHEPVDFSGVLKQETSGPGNLMFHGEAANKNMKAVVSGNFGEVFTKDMMNFEIVLAADQLSDLGILIGKKLPEVGPVHFKGNLAIEGDVIRLEQFEAKAGASDIAGHLTFTTAGRTVRGDDILGGSLISDKLNLSELIPEPKAVEITVLEKHKMVEINDNSPSSDARLFSTKPLPLEQLRNLQTKIELKVGKVITRQVVLDKLKMTLSLVNDVLMLQPFSAQIGGQPVSLNVMLDASQNPVAFEFSVRGDDLKVAHSELMLSKLGLEGGEFSFDMDVRGQGSSLADVMAGLNGTVAMGIVNSRITNITANKFGETLLNQAGSTSKASDSLNIQCSAVYFEITDGIATTPRGLAAQFEKVTWLGYGSINLGTEQIKISAKPQPRKGISIGLNKLAKLVVLGGTLTKPVMQIDPSGVVGASAHYAAAISTAGISVLLVGLLEKSQANEPVCLQILEPQVESTKTERDGSILQRSTRVFKQGSSPEASKPEESGLMDQD